MTRPSHYTQAQVARLLGITRQAVGQRVKTKSMKAERILGVVMIRSSQLPSTTPEAPVETATKPTKVKK